MNSFLIIIGTLVMGLNLGSMYPSPYAAWWKVYLALFLVIVGVVCTLSDKQIKKWEGRK